MATLSSIWSQVTALIEDGVSVIPIRDKDEKLADGKILPRKSPYPQWKKYQTSRATKEELWYMLEKFNTAAIATICGKVSGNLEGIDIDVKWAPGIAELIFNEINNLYPELYKRLRIHKTPSGGYHILYRIADRDVSGNKKLAMRPSTEEELKVNEKAKFKCFVETRGEGGYLAAPPSMDYTVINDVPIPVITAEERDNLISICTSFNQYDKEEDAYKPSKQESVYYSKNPFEHYNESQDSEMILTKFGWTFLFRNNRALYFSRPGSKSKGIHAAFLFKNRVFYFFTTNSEFVDGRCYRAATVWAKLEFNDDKKRLFAQLVKNGYGQIRPEIEKSLVKKAAINKQGLPANISDQAKEQAEKAGELLKQSAAYGVFWELNEKNKIEINRERLMTVAEGLGFRYFKKDLVQIVGKFVCKREVRDLQDSLKNYIYDEDGDLMIEIYNSFEDWMEKHEEQLVVRLKLMQDSELYMDTPTHCYKFFNNGVLKIDAEKIEFATYDCIDKLVEAHKLQNRDYIEGATSGRYCQFLQLACNYENDPEYVEKIIGYLSHEFKDETTGYIIVMTEQCPDPKQGGGSGKNIFVNLLKNTTTVANKPGSQVKFDERLLQSWNGEKIFNLSDVPKKFDFMFFKDLSTGSGILKKLFKDEREIPVHEMPKFVVSTNYSYDVKDGGLARRIIPIEFTDFFTKAGGVDLHFGVHFTTGWNSEDWVGYDNLIAKAVQTWLAGGRKISPKGLSEGGSTKQYDQMFGSHARVFIDEHWEKWWSNNQEDDGWVDNQIFITDYKKFCLENNIGRSHELNAIMLGKAIVEYFKSRSAFDSENKTKRVDGEVRRGKTIPPYPAPF
jgi:hypothetical protein